MNNLTHFTVIAAPQIALKKLSRAGIPVFECKKQGARIAFAVPDDFVQKVFAIFQSPCYNISVQRKSLKTRLKNFAVRRAFLFAGCAVFAAVCLISDLFVLRVEVTGSGAYLKNAVLGIARAAGLKTWAPYRQNGTQIISGVLSLPSVTFCSVHKRGSVVYIDVQTEEEGAPPAGFIPLEADRGGILRQLVAVCGTPLVPAGSNVAEGDALIAAYGNDGAPCLVSGYAVIECAAGVSYCADRESEENLNAAYSAALIWAGEEQVISRTHTVRNVAEGVIYEVKFSYLHTISINFD